LVFVWLFLTVAQKGVFLKNAPNEIFPIKNDYLRRRYSKYFFMGLIDQWIFSIFAFCEFLNGFIRVS
jgi:hypothetical protein